MKKLSVKETKKENELEYQIKILAEQLKTKPHYIKQLINQMAIKYSSKGNFVIKNKIVTFKRCVNNSCNKLFVSMNKRIFCSKCLSEKKFENKSNKIKSNKKNKVITGEEIRKIINQMDDHLDNYCEKFEDITYGLERILIKHEKTDELKSIKKKMIKLQKRNKKLEGENKELRITIKTFNQIKSE